MSLRKSLFLTVCALTLAAPLSAQAQSADTLRTIGNASAVYTWSGSQEGVDIVNNGTQPLICSGTGNFSRIEVQCETRLGSRSHCHRSRVHERRHFEITLDANSRVAAMSIDRGHTYDASYNLVGTRYYQYSMSYGDIGDASLRPQVHMSCHEIDVNEARAEREALERRIDAASAESAQRLQSIEHEQRVIDVIQRYDQLQSDVAASGAE